MVLWELDLAGETPAVRRVTDIQEALLLNGLANVGGCEPAVLVADSTLGVVFRAEVATGDYEKVLDVPETKRGPGSEDRASGVNGIKLHEGYLYWSNSDLHTIYRIQVDEKGYPLEGCLVENFATVEGVAFLDDFAIHSRGTIWATTNYYDFIVAIESNGIQTVIPGGLLAGSTAATFGRTSRDRDILYVIRHGSSGTASESAKVVAVDTRHFYGGDTS